MVTRSGVGTTSVTLSDRGTKDSKVEDTGANTTDVNPCISLIGPHSTSPAARGLRESQHHSGINRLALRERPSANALIASLAALLGVGFMVGVGEEGSALGDILAIGMTLSMAAMMGISRRYRDIPTMPAAALSALLSGLVCWPVGHPLAVSGHELAVLALCGLVNSALGLALFTVGSRCLPAIETALIGSLDAPLAPLWVWLVFGETPTSPTLVGGFIVFAAVAIHVIVEARAKQRPAPASNADMLRES